MIVLPGPVLLADPLPAGWLRPDPAPWRDPAEVAVTVERLAPIDGPEVDVGAEVWPGVTCAACRVSEACEGATCPCSCHDDPPLRGGAAFIAAVDAAHAAGMLGDLPDGCLDCGEFECVCHLPHVLDLEGIADTWAEQWRSLVEADPATLTAGAVRRRDAMVSIAAYVRATRIASPTRAERIEAAARALLAAQTDCEVGVDGAPRRAFAALATLRAALCTCTAHGPDPACVEHGAAIAKWQKENGT